MDESYVGNSQRKGVVGVIIDECAMEDRVGRWRLGD